VRGSAEKSDLGRAREHLRQAQATIGVLGDDEYAHLIKGRPRAVGRTAGMRLIKFREACTRCRFLRVDPAQLGRIEEMTTNAEARLAEARDNVWLGEVAALEESLNHLRRRRAEADARRVRPIAEFS
jgi:hypothetical protein